MVSIIVPVYNCEKFIRNTISTLKNFTHNTTESFEIIFVDDGSTDSTVKSIERSITENMYLVTRKFNGGKGTAVKEGVNYCKGDYIIFTDADLPYDLKVISMIVERLKSGFDIILGSRDLPESQSISFHGRRRRMLSSVFSFLADIVLLEPVSDTQCGIKGFSSYAAKKIFSQLKSKRYSFDVELIYLAQKFKLKIDLVPVILVNHYHSSVKLLRDGFIMLYDLVSLYIRINLFRG